MKQSLSPKELAEAIGVSESSLKRWADAGRLEVVRTVGGHRRISIPEAVRFSREANLPILRPTLLGLPDLETARFQRQMAGLPAEQSLLEQLKRGRTAQARATLVDLYLSGQSIAAIVDGPLRSAMTRLGEIWKHDDRGIFIEHRATDIIIQCLNLLRSLIVGEHDHREPPASSVETIPDNPDLPATVASSEDDRSTTGKDVMHRHGLPVAMGAAPAGDPYLIPSLAAACAMAEVGYHDINLGPDTPLDSLCQAVVHYRPQLVWLSCSSHDHVPLAREIVATAKYINEYDAALVVGGNAAPKRFADAPSNLQTCASITELAAFAKGRLAR